jgi:hypothetical protein
MGFDSGKVRALPCTPIKFMATPDRNDLTPASQEKLLQWVTPKIALMESGDTAGQKPNQASEDGLGNGPS